MKLSTAPAQRHITKVKAFCDSATRQLNNSEHAEQVSCSRWIGGGTHTGVAFYDLAVGALDTPNTGGKMYFSGTTIFTLRDGKIVDETGGEGALTALQQLGLVKGPNAGKEVKHLHE